ncbi:MAG: RHS repeat protein [Okeania sp. SIO3B3]|nr:RHS repeat protein [Okeania sp. SIO3B3]
MATIANSSAETASFTYGNGGLLSSFSDPKGNVYRFEYDELGRLKSREAPDGSFSLLSRTPTEKGFKVARITASGEESSYVTERLPDGKERQINKCCGAGSIAALTDKKGNQTISYPDGSTLIEEKQPDPRFGQLVPFTKRRVFTTPGGKMATVSSTRTVKLTDPKDPLTVEKIVDTVDFNGRVSTTTYDLQQRLVTYTSPGGRQRISTLDEKGRVTKSEIPGLEPVHFNYGERGELLLVQQGKQTILSYSYDEFCRLSGMRNSEGNEINYVCDESGRIVESTLPSGKVNKFSYDANGNLTEITVSSGAVHQLNYNTTNLALGSTNPQRGNTNSEYNSEQKPINKLLPSGRAIKNSYDRYGNLRRVSYPEADILINYLPKARGFQLIRTPADTDTAQKIAFGFDAILAPQLGFMETAIARQNRQRDSQKLLLNAIIPDIGLEKALSQQADGFLAQFGTFSYDRGLITEINYSGVAQGRYRYRYDENFFLVGVKLDDRPETILQRDADGLLVQLGDFQMERQGCYDLLTGISNGFLQVSLEYDDIGRIVKRTHAVKGRVVYQLSLGYDGLYQIVQKQETVLGKTKTYDYTLDRDGQLIRVAEKGVVVESYSYDDNGNRISWQLGRANPQTAKYDSQDRILELGNVAYQFDDDGFMTQRGATSFEYSSRGELMKVTLPDGKVITYAYDGVGRRVARSSDGGTYEYLYGNPEKPFQVTAVREPSGVLSVCYYDDLGFLFAMQRDEDWYYVATDQLGTPIVVLDATGETVKVVEYDSFGNQIVDSNPGFVFPIGFAAGLVDWETKLVRFGFRDYDPASGRWCAKDPIGFAAGDSNLYRYVNLNPVGLVDRSGEQPEGASQIPVLDPPSFSSGEGVVCPAIPQPGATANPGDYSSVFNTINSSNLSDGDKAELTNFVNDIISGNYEDYDSIRDRHKAYKNAQKLLDMRGINSQWFGAAAIVTQRNAIGGAEGVTNFFDTIRWPFNATSRETDKFLREGNEHLFAYNMSNLSHILRGEDIPGFEIPAHFPADRGLDYALVVCEQRKVTEFINNYSFKNKDKVIREINGSFSSMFASGAVKSVIKERFENRNIEFEFSNESHRIELGQGMIDDLYKQ